MDGLPADLPLPTILGVLGILAMLIVLKRLLSGAPKEPPMGGEASWSEYRRKAAGESKMHEFLQHVRREVGVSPDWNAPGPKIVHYAYVTGNLDVVPVRSAKADSMVVYVKSPSKPHFVRFIQLLSTGRIDRIVMPQSEWDRVADVDAQEVRATRKPA